MAGSEDVKRRLRALGVAFNVIACDPALADTATFCATYGVPLEDSANTIIVASRSEPSCYAACVLLATSRLDVNRTVRQRLGVRKASFAGPEETRTLTGMELGGVTAFGLPDDLPLWIDARVMQRPRVVLGGGDRTCKIAVAPAALLLLPGAEVVEGLAVAPPASDGQT
ncbi:MAG TPA: YbaK/EbsC family protein [Dehalococcoidia bacterium]|jgi:prolyl-tRNA editing enzyme YbaK/EbsC (Cys-tRNA(Pro) deacylase)|nr:YbaK/EbsC family protein [Dehalococcoidia bacterium]